MDARFFSDKFAAAAPYEQYVPSGTDEQQVPRRQPQRGAQRLGGRGDTEP